MKTKGGLGCAIESGMLGDCPAITKEQHSDYMKLLFESGPSPKALLFCGTEEAFEEFKSLVADHRRQEE